MRSTLPRSSCPSERLLWKNLSSPPLPFQNLDSLLLLCMSSLSVLDIYPVSDVWFTCLPSPSGGCLLICGWFPLLGAYLWPHPRVDFCPVPSADALEESQWTSRPHSPKACSSAVHLFLLTQLVCGSMRVPFLRSSLDVGGPYPLWTSSSSCGSHTGYTQLFPFHPRGLRSAGAFWAPALWDLPATAELPSSCLFIYPPHVYFQSLCFTLRS